MKQVNLSEASIIQPSPNQISSDLSGEAVLLHLTSGTYFGLDEIGALVWTLIQEKPTSLQQICDAIVAEYDVTYEQCETDIRRLIGELITADLVVVQ